MIMIMFAPNKMMIMVAMIMLLLLFSPRSVVCRGGVAIAVAVAAFASIPAACGTVAVGSLSRHF